MIETTEGLRWEAGRERMRERRARPRLKAMSALNEGNVRDEDFSRVVSSLNCYLVNGMHGCNS